jgi:hypothetical protein
MIELQKISDVPRNAIYKLITTRTLDGIDVDYYYFHKSLMFFSCYSKVKDLTKEEISDRIDKRWKT